MILEGNNGKQPRAAEPEQSEVSQALCAWEWGRETGDGEEKNNNQSKKYFKMCPNLVKRLIFPYLHWPSLSFS